MAARDFDPVVAAQVWLRSTLVASSALAAVVGTRIFTHPAPRTQPDKTPMPYPLVTYDYLPRRQTLRVVNGVEIWNDLLFLVRVIGDGYDPYTLQAASTAIFNALHNKRAVTAQGTIQSCLHERAYAFPEATESRQFYHLGGEYRVRVTPASS